MAQAPLPPAPDSSKCPGVQESVAKILFARRWVAAYGVCEVEGVFWGFFPLGKSWNAQRFQQGEHRQNGNKSILFWSLFSFGVTLQNPTCSRRKKFKTDWESHFVYHECKKKAHRIIIIFCYHYFSSCFQRSTLQAGGLVPYAASHSGRLVPKACASKKIANRDYLPRV